MDSWGTIIGAWAIVLGVIALYAAWLLLRARMVARELHLGEGTDAGTGHAGPASDHAEQDS